MSIFKDLMWYFKLEKKSYLAGVVLLVFVAVLGLYPPYVVRVIIDAIQAGTLTPEDLSKWMLSILAVAAVIYVFRYVWRIMIFGAAVRFGKLLRNRLYKHFTKMSPQFYHKRRIGDLMAHSTNDVQAVETTAGEGVLMFVDSLTVGGAVLITMAVFIDWKLTLIVMIPMPFMAWAMNHYGSLLHERFHKAQEAFSDINDKVQENVSGVRVIKAFGQEEAEQGAFEAKSKDVVEKNIAVARIDALFDPTISLIVGVSFFLAIAFGAMFVVGGELTLGELTQFTLYLGYLIWPMLAFGWLFNIVERGRASYDRITALLNIKAEIYDRDGASDVVPTGTVEYDIRTFTYPEKSVPTLEDIRIKLEPGSTLGLVGKTGSGKTTLLKLLLREFDLAGGDGDISIGGVSIYDIKLNALRGAIGYVPQDHFLFSATIAENIAFGKPEASMEEIRRAASLARIHEDIIRFEDGYGTIVGERGVTLSGGQKQRISIARALLMDPQILVLDDSLSAVDAKTEEEILEALRSNRENKTTIISAHRLSAIEHAECIIVLEEGKIIESGTHEQLMKAGGWYAAMYQRQQLETIVAQGGATS